MKKKMVLIAVLMAMALLLAACGQKTYTVKDFEGKWKLVESSTHGEGGLTGFARAATTNMQGGLVISGERICLADSLEFDILDGDICTFEVKDGKMIFHDLGLEDIAAFGDFEADFKLEGKKWTLTKGEDSVTLEKR